MNQAQLIRTLYEKTQELNKYARELNRWESADCSDVEHLETLLNECIDALSELEDSAIEGEDE